MDISISSFIKINYSYLERGNASPSQSEKRISRLGTRWRTLARWRERAISAHEIWKRSTSDLDARSPTMHDLLPVPDLAKSPWSEAESLHFAATTTAG